MGIQYSAGPTVSNITDTSVDFTATVSEGGYSNDLVWEVTVGDAAYPSLTYGPTGYDGYGIHDCTIQWGDGESSTISSFDDAGYQHTYAGAGTYIIRLSGTMSWFQHTTNSAVRRVLQMGDTSVARCYAMWYQCDELHDFNTGPVCNMSGNTNSESFLAFCPKLTSAVLKGFTFNRCNTFFRDCVLLSYVSFENADGSTTDQMNSFFQNCPELVSVDHTTDRMFSNVTRYSYYLRYCYKFDQAITWINWKTGVDSSVDFLAPSPAKLSTANYDTTLAHIRASSALTTGQTMDFSDSTYSATGAIDRQWIIENYTWVITDAGQEP